MSDCPISENIRDTSYLHTGHEPMMSAQQQMQELIFTMQLRELSTLPPTKESEGYEFFRTLKSRQQVMQVLGATSDYVSDNSVDALVLLDSGARPMGVAFAEYWRLTREQDERRPDIFFLKPSGFKKSEDTTHQLEQRHPYLNAHKDSTVMLVDTCMHDGNSMRPVLEGLTVAGFDDLKIGTMGGHGNTSGIDPDLVVIPGKPAEACYPFMIDTITERNGGSGIISRPRGPNLTPKINIIDIFSGDPFNNTWSREPGGRDQAIRLRKELVRIVRESVAEQEDDIAKRIKSGKTRGYQIGYIGGITTGLGLNVALSVDSILRAMTINMATASSGALIGSGVGLLLTKSRIMREIGNQTDQ